MKYSLTLAAFALAACAQSPDNVTPAQVSMSASCAEVTAMLQREQQQEANLTDQQMTAATGDAWGVFLIGFPVASMAGNDVADDLAESRGRVAALNARQQECAAR